MERKKFKIIDKKELKKYILDLCKEINPQYTKVDSKFLDRIEESFMFVIKEKVLFCNKDGKTLK